MSEFRRQQGLALPLVLWIITLLSIMAGGFALLMKNEIGATRALQDQVRSEALIDGALNQALLYLSGLPAASDPLLAEEFVDLDLFGVPLILRVTPSTALVDLNKARPALLRRLFEAVGVDDEEIDRLIDRIADWRDRDDARRANGAEKDDYEAADKYPPPKNAKFDSVVELHQVLGIDDALYQRLAPYVTIGGGSGIDPSYAPRALLRLLSGEDEPLQAARGAEAFTQWTPRLGGGLVSRGRTRSYRIEVLMPDRRGRVRAYVVARVMTGARSDFDKFANARPRILGKREGIAPTDIVEYARHAAEREETDGS